MKLARGFTHYLLGASIALPLSFFKLMC